ncbi:MAG: cadherin domain-containing protein [Planctomycetaceae bacterium]|nr:cadherin domain-containing protein [Planctomycetaceae bacterium]
MTTLPSMSPAAGRTDSFRRSTPLQRSGHIMRFHWLNALRHGLLVSSGSRIRLRRHGALGVPSAAFVQKLEDRILLAAGIVAADDTYQATTGQTATLDVLNNDIDPNGMGVEIINVTGVTPGGPTLAQNQDGTLSFQSNASGSFTFDYSVTGRQYQVLAYDGNSSDHFGYSVAIDGDYATVGAYLDVVNGQDNRGSAYIFVRSNGNWIFQQQIAGYASNASRFGTSVAISGNLIVVGAEYAEVNGDDQGAAYIYRQIDGRWYLQYGLYGGDLDGYDNLGHAVAISGSTVVVGAPGDGNGTAFVYTDTGSGWALQATLTPSDGSGSSDAFGQSLSISGDTIVVGSDDDGNDQTSGAAYVYSRMGNTWLEQAKLVADTSQSVGFGDTVAVSSDTIVVGAKYQDYGSENDAGAAYVFSRSGTQWQQVAKLLSDEPDAYDHFGSSVAISGDALVIGADQTGVSGQSYVGAAYVFTLSNGEWRQHRKILATGGGLFDYFGRSVAISGNTIVVGMDEFDTASNSDQGAAYIQNWTIDDASVTMNVTGANNPPTNIGLSATAVAENQPAGTVVGNFSTTDPDAGDSFTYTLVTGTGSADNGSFTIAGNQLKTASSFDFEAKSSYTIRIRSTDQGGLYFEKTFTIGVTDAVENQPPTNMALSATAVAENQPAGTVVGNFSSTDPDAGNTFTYTPVAGTGSADNASFSIAGNQLKTASSFNFESKSSYAIRIRSTDQGDLYFEKTFTIGVNDVAEGDLDDQIVEALPVPISDVVTGRIDPGTDVDLVGFTVAAGERVMFDIDRPGGSSLDSYIRLFDGSGLQLAFNDDSLASPAPGESGSVESFLDHTFAVAGMYYLGVSAYPNSNYNPVTGDGDAAGTSTGDYSLNLTRVADVNNAPTANNATFAIAENRPSGHVVGTDVATDPDAGQTLTYAITAGNTGNVFAINTGTGQITVASPTLNFEGINQYNLTVQATDNGTPALSDTATVTINITNLNEAPMFLAPTTFTISENRPVGQFVGDVNTSDPEGNTVTYSIVGGDPNTQFAINSATGVITVAKATINYEATPQFLLSVKAQDNGSPANSRTQTITVNIANLNEAPAFLAPTTFTISENRPVGQFVGDVNTADPEGNTVTYSITGGDPNAQFAINSATGVITIAKATINFEATPQFLLSVKAQDNGSPANSRTQTITVNIANLNEAPNFLAPTTFTIQENRPNGTVVGTVITSDPENNTRTYSITAGNTNNGFAINAASGQIIVNNSAALDFETTPQFLLSVKAQDNGSPANSRTQTITINLTDIVGARVPAKEAATSLSLVATGSTGQQVTTSPPATAVLPNRTTTTPTSSDAALLSFTLYEPWTPDADAAVE